MISRIDLVRREVYALCKNRAVPSLSTGTFFSTHPLFGCKSFVPLVGTQIVGSANLRGLFILSDSELSTLGGLTCFLYRIFYLSQMLSSFRGTTAEDICSFFHFHFVLRDQPTTPSLSQVFIFLYKAYFWPSFDFILSLW